MSYATNTCWILSNFHQNVNVVLSAGVYAQVGELLSHHFFERVSVRWQLWQARV